MDEAVEIAHEGLFSNHGQSCCAGSRTFVQDTVYDEFVKKATDLASKRVVGDPFTQGVQQGPQVVIKDCKILLGNLKEKRRILGKLFRQSNLKVVLLVIK